MQIGDHVIHRKHGLLGVVATTPDGITVIGKYRDGIGFQMLSKPMNEVERYWRKLGEGENGNRSVEGYGINVTFSSTELSSEVRNGLLAGLEALFAEYENVLIGIKPITNEEET